MLNFSALPSHVLIEIGLLFAGLTALYFGAEWLVNSAAKISLKFGISPLAVGLTVVAFGTSAPELFVSLGFASEQPDMAIGSVIGSNICNIGLVLGVSAFICSMAVKRSLLTRDVPALLITSLLFVFFIRDENVSTFEGGFMFACILGYTIYRLRSSMKKGVAAAEVELEEVGSREEALKAPNLKLIFMVLAGIFVLYIGADALIFGGEKLAKRLNVPGAIISLSLIALGTSVPELATSVVATLKREGDLIIGNIIGSCLFNLLCVIGVTALVQPLAISQISNIDLWVMLAFTFLLLPIMASKSAISRWEGSILLIGYLFYAAYLWIARRVDGVEEVALFIAQ